MTRKTGLSKTEEFLQANRDRAIRQKLRQFRYIYFIDRRVKKDCLLTQMQPPKHYLEEKKPRFEKALF